MAATFVPTKIGDTVSLYLGDCVEVLRSLPDASVDAIVTDPPAGIAFMGKSWDTDKGGRDAWIAWLAEVAAECLRVVKPGGHALVWALPRTSHWTGMAWENAGWEPRDKIVHLFGSGFPKSLNVSKAIDRAAGAEREVVGEYPVTRDLTRHGRTGDEAISPVAVTGTIVNITAPATADAKAWEGWGTALKPAAEDWWLMRKPLDGTVAGNVLKHGTGALNIDGARVAGEPWVRDNTRGKAKQYDGWGMKPIVKSNETGGRWPANVMHDGSPEVVDRLGEASRFFYCAKASRTDREEGCEHLPTRSGAEAVDREEGSAGTQSPRAGAGRTAGTVRNHHPTVKNVELMRYLCRLITPPGGTVLDPFTGSGSTGKGAVLESFAFVGIERESDYLQIAAARIAAAVARAPGATAPPVTPPAPIGRTSILTASAPWATATAKTAPKTATAQLSLLDALDALWPRSAERP